MPDSPDLVLQRVINDILTTHLSSVPSGAHPPGERSLPYIQFGNSEVNDNPVGHDLLMYVHTWSSTEGPHQVKAYQQTIREQLHGLTTSRDSWQFVNVREEFCDVILDEDEETWHGVQRFRTLASSI